MFYLFMKIQYKGTLKFFKNKGTIKWWYLMLFWKGWKQERERERERIRYHINLPTVAEDNV